MKKKSLWKLLKFHFFPDVSSLLCVSTKCIPLFQNKGPVSTQRQWMLFLSTNYFLQVKNEFGNKNIKVEIEIYVYVMIQKN